MSIIILYFHADTRSGKENQLDRIRDLILKATNNDSITFTNRDELDGNLGFIRTYKQRADEIQKHLEESEKGLKVQIASLNVLARDLKDNITLAMKSELEVISEGITVFLTNKNIEIETSPIFTDVNISVEYFQAYINDVLELLIEVGYIESTDDLENSCITEVSK
ncbi:hypothetical protein FACS1894202_07580 [Clostridia bacterium]|nr:hypothetical protein FACS1894202_07580 [Clostridia bacterium]